MESTGIRCALQPTTLHTLLYNDIPVNQCQGTSSLIVLLFRIIFDLMLFVFLSCIPSRVISSENVNELNQ